MKKIMKLASALCCSLMAVAMISCNKDNSDNHGDGKAKASFNMATMYQDLGVEALMIEKLVPGNFVIFDSLLVYDQAGSLITKLGMEGVNLEHKEIELNPEDFPKGTYTLILWQSIYRTTDGLRAWKLQEEENLSTVRLSIPFATFDFGWALGYAASTVTLDGKAIDLDLTPKALGCVFDTTIDNIAEGEDYSYVSLVGGRHYQAVNLDPSLGEDRWVAPPQSQVSGVPIRINPKTFAGNGKFFTFIHGEKLGIEIRGDKEGGYDHLGSVLRKDIEVGNKYTLYTDLARQTWQPAFFGSAEDFTAWKADRDAGHLVFAPFLGFGSDISAVEENIHSRQWWTAESGQLQAIGTRWAKVFHVADELIEAYLFETEDGRNLLHSQCQCLEPSVSIDIAHSMLIDKGYIYKGKIRFPGSNMDKDIYFSADDEIEVLVHPFGEGYWVVDFQRADPNDLQYIITNAD